MSIQCGSLPWAATYLYKDNQEAPQIQSAIFEWENRDLIVTFETKGGLFNPEAEMGTTYPFMGSPNTVGNIFIGTEGYMVIPDYGSYYTFLGKNRTPGPQKSANKKDLSGPHFENFLKAVRSRNPGDLNAGPRELHYSSVLAHLANISLRTKREVIFDPEKERFVEQRQSRCDDQSRLPEALRRTTVGLGLDPMLLRLVAGLLLATAASWAVEKPNLVFILADDMGYGDRRAATTVTR